MTSRDPLHPIPFVQPGGKPEGARGSHTTDGPASPLIGFPGPQTTFVGRRAEMATLRTLLLDPHQRLVSVVGSGGVGKTRLVLATAADVAPSFPDGVAFVALAGLREPHQITDALATTLDIRGQADRPMLASLLTALTSANLLLVLDNLEHLLGPDLQSLVMRVLQACSLVKILTTSREPLQLGLEQRLVLSPMPVPAAGEHASDVTRAESVQLFLARARTVAPDFAPRPDDVRRVGEICRRVDGLPLAIELAAAWIRALSPTALLAQLDDQLPLLAGGAAEQPARLRSMRDAIAWSYDRLPPDEAALLQTLSVFRGGLPLPGAARVHDATAIRPSRSTLDLVAALCDKHLLFSAGAIGEIPRFGMLETVRAFVHERLVAASGLDTARAAHARYYRDVAEQAEPDLLGPREQHWFAFYTAEANNLREAIVWGLEHDADLALRLLSASWGQWSWRGVAEGLRLVTAALALPDSGSPFVRARGLRTAAAFAHLTGDYERGATFAAEGATYIDRIDDRWLQGELAWNCAARSLFAGNFRQAADDLDLALARMDAPRSASERAIRAYVRSHRGLVDYVTGANDAGARRYAQSVDELRHIGGSAFPIIVLSDAAGWLLLEGRVSEAHPLLEEALHLATHAHTSWMSIMPLSGLALIDAMQDHPRRAARRLGAVAAMVSRADLILPPNFQGTLDRAAALASEALGSGAFRNDYDAGYRTPAPVLQDALLDARAGMTRRERDVLDLMVAGRTDRDIAEALYISERTVSKHVSAILQKLEAVSRADAAVRAVRLGLV